MEIDGLDSAKCQKSRRRDMMRIIRIVNDNKTKDEQCPSSSKRPKIVQWLVQDVVSLGFVISRERMCLLSRILADRTVDFRRSKK